MSSKITFTTQSLIEGCYDVTRSKLSKCCNVAHSTKRVCTALLLWSLLVMRNQTKSSKITFTDSKWNCRVVWSEITHHGTCTLFELIFYFHTLTAHEMFSEAQECMRRLEMNFRSKTKFWSLTIHCDLNACCQSFIVPKSTCVHPCMGYQQGRKLQSTGVGVVTVCSSRISHTRGEWGVGWTIEPFKTWKRYTFRQRISSNINRAHNSYILISSYSNQTVGISNYWGRTDNNWLKVHCRVNHDVKITIVIEPIIANLQRFT